MIRKIISIFLGLIILAIPEFCRADGGILPPPNYYVSETDQKAVIAYQDKVETLVLSVTFKGNPKDFGWVIPFPNQPQIEKSSDSLFTALAKKTTLQPINFGLIPGLWNTHETSPLNINVIETQQIDIYEIKTVAASDAKDLTKWLTNNGYQIPEKASTILTDYVKKKWYFVCIKIDLSQLTDVKKGELATGHAVPLKFQFESDEIIYPLKLSSIIEEYVSESPEKNTSIRGLTPVPQVSILIYVIADNKKTVSNFDISYANWIKKEEIEELAYDSEGISWFKPRSGKMFLTKFSKTLKTTEMTDDLIFKNASDNEPIGVAQPNIYFDILSAIVVFVFAFLIFLLSPVCLIFLILALIQFIAKSKISQTILWAFQVIFFLLSLLASLIISFIIFRNLNYIFEIESIGQTIHFKASGIAIMIALLCVLIFEILIMVWQFKKQKNRNKKKQDIGPQKKAEEMFQEK